MTEDAYRDSGASPPRFLGARLLEPIPFIHSETFDQRTPGVDYKPYKPKNKLDALYAAYAANPSDENLNALFADILKYTKSVLWGGGQSRVVDVEEIAQRVVIKVWACIGDFKGQSKFRSWVYRIVINTALDAIRSAPPEVQPPEDADEAERLLYYGGIENRDDPSPSNGCYRAAAGVEDYDGWGSDGGVGHRTHIKSEAPGHALIDGRDDEARTELLYEIAESSTSPDWLNEDYRVVLWLTLTGWKANGIAKILHMTTKQVSNQIAAAKRILRKRLSKS